MRKLSLIVALVSITFYSCKDNAAKKVSDATAKEAKERMQNAGKDLPEMTFVSKDFEFGTINEGDEITASFEYENTGGSDLVITNAKASCGCTVPEWPKGKAIKPGEKGLIKALFRSRGKRNAQNKSITLTTNTASLKEILHVKGFVTPDPVKEAERKARTEKRKAAEAKKKAAKK